MARVSNLANEQEISALFRAILGCYFSFTLNGPIWSFHDGANYTPRGRGDFLGQVQPLPNLSLRNFPRISFAPFVGYEVGPRHGSTSVIGIYVRRDKPAWSRG